MRRRIHPAALSLGLAFSAMVAWPAQAQPSRPAPPADRPASNIDVTDTRTITAPALPIPDVLSGDSPFVFLEAARDAVEAGRTGEAQEELERAETRLLERSALPTDAALPDTRQAVLAITSARRALAAYDRTGAVAAINDALAASGRDRVVADAPALPPASSYAAAVDQVAEPLPSGPAFTQVLLPGHWKLVGATYTWVPPETVLHPVQAAVLVPGRFVWTNGAYGWVPAHYAR